MSTGIDHLIINSPYEEPRQHWNYIFGNEVFHADEWSAFRWLRCCII